MAGMLSLRGPLLTRSGRGPRLITEKIGRTVSTGLESSAAVATLVITKEVFGLEWSELAGLLTVIMLVGAGFRFTIWGPSKNLRKHNEQITSQLKALNEGQQNMLAKIEANDSAFRHELTSTKKELGALRDQFIKVLMAISVPHPRKGDDSERYFNFNASSILADVISHDSDVG